MNFNGAMSEERCCESMEGERDVPIKNAWLKDCIEIVAKRRKSCQIN